jgi:hypothetical protein
LIRFRRKKTASQNKIVTGLKITCRSSQEGLSNQSGKTSTDRIIAPVGAHKICPPVETTSPSPIDREIATIPPVTRKNAIAISLTNGYLSHPGIGPTIPKK